MTHGTSSDKSQIKPFSPILSLFPLVIRPKKFFSSSFQVPLPLRGIAKGGNHSLYNLYKLTMYEQLWSDITREGNNLDNACVD